MQIKGAKNKHLSTLSPTETIPSISTNPSRENNKDTKSYVTTI